MSYVEKAFWTYLKSTLFGGVRILFSRQLIVFSLILIITSVVTTGTVAHQNKVSDIITKEVLNFVFLAQISIAIGFIISGVFSKYLNLFFRFLLLLVVVLIVQIIFFMAQEISSLDTVSTLLIQVFPLVAFLSWAFLVPLASFSFSKGLFSNKTLGSVLFLGKSHTDHKAIFSGVMTIIAFFSLFWNVAMIYIGFNENRLSYFILGILGVLIAFLIILVVHGKFFSDDVFNTTLGFFFVMNLPNQIMIFLTSVNGSQSVETTFTYVFILFSIIYSTQNVSRRIKMKGIVIDPTKKSNKRIKEDPLRIGRFIGFIGGEGVVLIFFGLYLGFHLIQLQVISGLAEAYEFLFGATPFSEVYHDISMVFMVLILFFVFIFYALQHGKGYWEADIYRFGFLPPYEDLVDYMEQIKRGKISKTDIALTIGKQAVAASGFDILSTVRKIFFDKKRNS
ncbi:MAG: hypothetical protein ACTSW1_14735 [Candidatus Hodarchaeales archaeon]